MMYPLYIQSKLDDVLCVFRVSYMMYSL